MAKALKSYRDWLGAKLTDPERAARYLNTAAEDSEAMFLKALRKVAASQTRSMTELAEACGVSRESLYRMLSESGNPTSENRRAILAAMGLKSIVVPIDSTADLNGPPTAVSAAFSFAQSPKTGKLETTPAGTLHAGVFASWTSSTGIGIVGNRGLDAALSQTSKKSVAMEFPGNSNVSGVYRQR